jgi:P pilus assembly chaperone PapD
MKLLILATFLFPSLAYAQAQVFPTRITLTEEAPSSYLNLRNSTGATQKYRIELASFKMQKDGSQKRVVDASNPLFEAIKFSPKSIEIQAGEKQVVRVMATAFEEIPEGDQVVYLHIVPESGDQSKNDDSTKPNGSMSLQAKIAVAVPIIVRQGPPKLDGKIAKIQAIFDKKGDLDVSFVLRNSTKYFLTGDLELFATDGKEEVLLSRVNGVSSYLPERTVNYKIGRTELDELGKNGENLRKIKGRYASNADSGSQFELIAEVDVSKKSERVVKKKKKPSKPQSR